MTKILDLLCVYRSQVLKFVARVKSASGPYDTVGHTASGLSRLSDQGRMVAMSGGSRPNQFCKCAIFYCMPTYYILYIVICDINMTTFDKGGVNNAWLGEVEFFKGIARSPLWGD